jgi:hypothetical protein
MTDKPTCIHARQKLYRGELSCCVCGVKLPPQPWMADGGIHPNNVFPLVWTADEDAEPARTDGYTRQTITWPNPTHSWNAHAIIQSGDAEPCAECETEEDKDE